MLAEISLLVKQSDPDYRHTQIAGRFQLVPGHIPQAARENRQRVAQHEFHAEVSHRAEIRIRMLRLEPSVAFAALATVCQNFVQLLPEFLIAQRGFEFGSRNSLKHQPRIVREVPQFRVDLLP